MEKKAHSAAKHKRTPSVRATFKTISGYVGVSFCLILLLVWGLTSVDAFKWENISQIGFSGNEEPVVEYQMPALHDEAPSKLSQFSSELEQDCYLAFAGTVCGYANEARRARGMVGEFLNQLNQSNPSVQVQACARGVERIRAETAAMTPGKPHCNTAKAIVESLRTSR